MHFSGRRHGVYQIQGKEFISIFKQYQALSYPHWNLCFTITTSALEYVCQMKEHSSTFAKFVVSATVFVSIKAYQGINKTQKGIFIYLCFAMVSLMQNK